MRTSKSEDSGWSLFPPIHAQLSLLASSPSEHSQAQRQDLSASNDSNTVQSNIEGTQEQTEEEDFVILAQGRDRSNRAASRENKPAEFWLWASWGLCLAVLHMASCCWMVWGAQNEGNGMWGALGMAGLGLDAAVVILSVRVATTDKLPARSLMQSCDWSRDGGWRRAWSWMMRCLGTVEEGVGVGVDLLGCTLLVMACCGLLALGRIAGNGHGNRHVNQSQGHYEAEVPWPSVMLLAYSGLCLSLCAWASFVKIIRWVRASEIYN
jgi:hypothetical protein